jgi:hypothetical protein
VLPLAGLACECYKRKAFSSIFKLGPDGPINSYHLVNSLATKHETSALPIPKPGMAHNLQPVSVHILHCKLDKISRSDNMG